MTPAQRTGLDRATLAFLAVAVGLTWLRIALLRMSTIDLYFDEAQYWAWSRTLELGYFTKPPLVAWVIAATTGMFGDAEWAVRLAAPLAHGIAALALFGLGRSMYGAWAGFWAGVTWLLIPGVSLSANVISTDALLLPLWAVALYAMWRLVETRAWVWAALLGVTLGLGVQAKYAMLYFPLCAATAAYWHPPMRQALGGGRALAAALIAFALVAPNLYWNAQHGFVTAQHTAANARLDAADLFNLDELFEFIGGQAGVIGPLVFAALIWLFWQVARRASGLTDKDKVLLAFMAPPLIFVSIVAFVSRANANWAAAAYPAAIVWVCGNLTASVNGRRFLAAATALNFGLAALAMFIMTDPAISNRFKGVRNARGWEETAREIALRAVAQPGETPFTAVLVDDRATFFELGYYWRHARRASAPLPPVRMWLLHGQAHNSAELTDPMRTEEGARVLIVHLTPDYLPLVAGDFTVFRAVEHLTIPLGGEFNREVEISVGEGFAQAPRDEAFEQRLHDRSLH
jgi:4-amino-4-deoxy-L-arabinose transferase-like glycosyltransferase